MERVGRASFLSRRSRHQLVSKPYVTASSKWGRRSAHPDEYVRPRLPIHPSVQWRKRPHGPSRNVINTLSIWLRGRPLYQPQKNCRKSVILAAYKELEEGVGLVTSGSQNKTVRIKRFVEGRISPRSLNRIFEMPALTSVRRPSTVFFVNCVKKGWSLPLNLDEVQNESNCYHMNTCSYFFIKTTIQRNGVPRVALDMPTLLLLTLSLRSVPSVREATVRWARITIPSPMPRPRTRTNPRTFPWWVNEHASFHIQMHPSIVPIQ